MQEIINKPAWSENGVKGQYAGRFISSAQAALDKVTRITLMPRNGTAVPFPAFPARDYGVKGTRPLAGS